PGTGWAARLPDALRPRARPPGRCRVWTDATPARRRGRALWGVADQQDGHRGRADRVDPGRGLPGAVGRVPVCPLVVAHTARRHGLPAAVRPVRGGLGAARCVRRCGGRRGRPARDAGHDRAAPADPRSVGAGGLAGRLGCPPVGVVGWIVLALVTWAALAVLVGVLLGQAIRLRNRR